MKITKKDFKNCVVQNSRTLVFKFNLFPKSVQEAICSKTESPVA